MKEVTKSYDKKDNMKCLALLVLAYMINEKESDQINSDNNMINLILDTIKKATESVEDDGRHNGFRACEIMNDLNKLAINESNKQLIIDGNGLPLYAALMASNRSDEDKRIAASGLWTLSHTRKKDILNNKNCMEGA